MTLHSGMNCRCGLAQENVGLRAEIERLRDKVDGLESDLSAAVELAFNTGNKEWVMLNYPEAYDKLLARAALDKEQGRMPVVEFSTKYGRVKIITPSSMPKSVRAEVLSEMAEIDRAETKPFSFGDFRWKLKDGTVLTAPPDFPTPKQEGE